MSKHDSGSIFSKACSNMTQASYPPLGVSTHGPGTYLFFIGNSTQNQTRLACASPSQPPGISHKPPGWLCLTSHRQRGHLETAPPLIHRSDREWNSIYLTGVSLHHQLPYIHTQLCYPIYPYTIVKVWQKHDISISWCPNM